MKNRMEIAGAVVVFAALAGFHGARGIESPTPPPTEPLHYQASCSVIESSSLDGYVSNLSPDTYLVSGEGRFKFTAANTMSRPEIRVQANGVIPAGKTVRVSSAPLTFELCPGETCRFTVKGVIRKQ